MIEGRDITPFAVRIVTIRKLPSFPLRVVTILPMAKLVVVIGDEKMLGNGKKKPWI